MSPYPTVDHDVFISFKSGNELSFKYIFLDYYPIIYKYFERNLKEGSVDIEELANKALLKIWDNRDKLNNLLHMKRFLFACGRNALYNIYKERKSIIITGIPDYLKEFLSYEGDNTKIEGSFWNKVIELIEEMPEAKKRVFKEHIFTGKENKDIAEKIGISVQTVKNTLTIAREFLRFRLQNFKFE